MPRNGWLLAMPMLLSCAGPGAGVTTTRAASTGSAEDVLRDAPVVDLHLDTPQWLLEQRYDLGEPRRDLGQVSLDSMRRGGVGAAFFVLWHPPERPEAEAHARALALAAAVRAQMARHPADLVMAGSVDELLAARAAGKIAVLLGMEGAEPLHGDLAELERMHALGVRYVGLTWNAHTAFADAGKPDAPRHGGLSPLGRAAVAEMNRLGIAVDVSHLSDASAAQAVAASRAPVLATHSCARALSEHRRNLPDDLVRAIAAGGGVVGVNFHSVFLDAGYAARAAAAEQAHAPEVAALARSLEGADPVERRWAPYLAELRVAHALPRPPLSVLVDHVEHLVKVAGVDHVGLGSDLDGGIVPPDGIESHADLPKLVAALLARGRSPEDVRKLLGGNVVRVLREVERVSRALRADAP
ncbi:Membrane dipeptidase [Anaeromyxobacter dehalogenans 2CP-1]|uniref:Membrane dipeptidase n=1 Tax=Anaeromyxobacter dehalogenans (strain ATCC BAA-258 / DSM 21875 / 2CP-1) TaxID=455488 RepID=B8J8J6_ANAD2|nr:dipeptidase [Anaeromyxobacter dehalogenans]ACL67282.1 Membrane dipeptidase [Anaeromyxobacter dehalogenans 2CP-1]